jgi:hypothetical protein
MPLSPARVLRQFRYAMFFDGVDDYVRVPNFLFSPDFTVSFWVYSLLRGNVWATYFGNADVVAKYNLWMRNNYYGPAPNMQFSFFGTDKNEYSSDVFAISTGWNHIVVTKSGLTIALYTNNVLRQRFNIPYDINYVSRDLVIAYPNGYGAGYLRGFMNQFIIYSRALSDSEIQWNYVNPDNPVRDGLVLWLRAHPDYVKDIDGDGLLEWLDLSGYGNHGKIYGATLVKLIRDPVR